jgi:hypothetical protein
MATISVRGLTCDDVDGLPFVVVKGPTVRVLDPWQVGGLGDLVHPEPLRPAVGCNQLNRLPGLRVRQGFGEEAQALELGAGDIGVCGHSGAPF